MAEDRKETPTEKFDRKLGKLIKHAKRNNGLLWKSVVNRLEKAQADVEAMIKVQRSGPR